MRVDITGSRGGGGALVLLLVALLALLPAAALANPGVWDAEDADEFDELPSIELLLQSYVEAVGGREAWGGDMVFLVETDGEELHRLGFDVETGLLTRLGFHRELCGYEEVDEVLMPHRVVYSRKGGASTFIVDSVVHNTAIDRNIFSLAK